MYIVQLIHHCFRHSNCYNACPIGQNNPQNCTFFWGNPSTHLTCGSLPTPHQSAHPKRHIDCSSRFSTTDCVLSLYFTMGQNMIPTKTALSNGEIEAMTEYMVPLAHPSPKPKQHLDQYSRFSTAHGRGQQTHTHRHTHTDARTHAHTHTHTQTDRPRYIDSKMPHLRTLCIQYSLIKLAV